MLYKTVKVPLWVYEDALDARADVLRQGLQFLPKDLLEPANCPRCGGDLEVLTAGYQRLECTSCGFKQEKIAASGTNMSGIGLGVLLGLGLAALFRASTGGVRPSREAVAGRAAAARIRRTAQATGASRLSDEEVEAEITAARKERRRRRRAG